MLPGKKYAPEDIIKILRKRFWLVVVPWALVAAATAGVARKLPDMYRSRAVIQVVPPQVPDSIVRSMSSQTFEQRLEASRQAILNRTRLERIIHDFDLYKVERANGQLMEQTFENMRKEISVRPVKGDAFTVEYIGRDPVTVMKVTERLAGLFKDESVNQGKLRAEDTNAFIESTVEESRRKLVETEDRLKKYEMAHSGELPDQAASNQNAIQGINMNLSQIAQALSSDAARVATLENLIAMVENPTESANVVVPVTGAEPIPANGTAAQRLAAAKAALADAIQVRRLGQNNPEVKLYKSWVDRYTKEVNDEALKAPVGAGGVAMSPAEQARVKNLQNMREELDVLKKNIVHNQSEEKRLRAQAAIYQARIDAVPGRRSELTEITREYGVLMKIYNDNVAKREASSMSVNLERRQIGEQFNLLDPARLPERPFSPDRIIINLIGLVGGLAVGLGLVALLEYRDGTFKADYEVASVLSLPVLAVVPLMRSDAERRSEFRKRLLLNIGFGSTVAVCLAVLAYTFVR